MNDNVIQMRKPTHALCDRCYPQWLTPPENLIAWCGEAVHRDDFPDEIELTEQGHPVNACRKCVETYNCVTCGLAQDAYEDDEEQSE